MILFSCNWNNVFNRFSYTQNFFYFFINLHSISQRFEILREELNHPIITRVSFASTVGMPRVEYSLIPFLFFVIACLLSSRRAGAFSSSEIHCENLAPMELTSFPFSGFLVKTTLPRFCVDVDVRTGSYIRVDRFRSPVRVALLDTICPSTPFIVEDIHSWRKEGTVICHVVRKDWT